MRATAYGRERRGQVIVLAPVMVVALGAVLALTVDVGDVFVWRARLQNSADAAALAGARVLWNQHIAGATEDAARSAALTEARLLLQANTIEAGYDIECGTTDGYGNFTAQPLSQQASAVRAKALRTSAPGGGGSVRLSFASLIGMNSCAVTGTAVAEATSSIRGATAGLGVSPFACPASKAGTVNLDDGNTSNDSIVFYPADGTQYDPNKGDQKVIPGCWGLLNLDGGSLGTPELVNWIENGYQGTIDIGSDGGTWIDGTSGFRAGIQAAMNTVIGKPIVVAVYDDVVGQGSNGLFHIIGFLRGTVELVHLTGKNAYLTFQVDGRSNNLTDLITGGSSTYQSPNILKIQLCK